MSQAPSCHCLCHYTSTPSSERFSISLLDDSGAQEGANSGSSGTENPEYLLEPLPVRLSVPLAPSSVGLSLNVM